MKWVDNFCKLRFLDTDNEGFKAMAELLPDHPVYKGHFPAQPVVPGVFTLALIRECASAVTGRDMEYADIKECKFISALLPAVGLKILFDFSLSPDGKLCGTVKRDDDIILKLKATLK